jgi:SAM-dependent methyltransferase
VNSSIKQFYDTGAAQYNFFEAALDLPTCPYPGLALLRHGERAFLSSIARGSRVLYVGAGTGRHILALAKDGCRVTGVEFSAEMINICQKNLREGTVYSEIKPTTSGRLEYGFSPGDSQSVILLQADINDLIFPDNFFDHAFCYCTLPLMGSDVWPQTLSKVLNSAKKSRISIYNEHGLHILAEAYSHFRLGEITSVIPLRTKSGFEYISISDSSFKLAVQKLGFQCKGLSLPTGRIYTCFK